MRCESPGRVTDRLWYLGHKESGIYLLEGRDQSLIISGGTSYIVPTVMRQLEEFSLKEDRILGMLILHSHFDHIGVIPYFKRRNPELRIFGSRRAWEVLSVPGNVSTINEFSRQIATKMGAGPIGSDLEWPENVQGEAVQDGDIINLGGVTLEIMETPGHSSCSISAYCPELGALFPSDGGGIPYKGTIVAAPNSNFDQYRASLQRMALLTVDYLCADHFGYVYGEEARSYIENSIKSADEEFQRLANIYRRSKDVDIAARDAASSFLDQNPDYFLTPDIYEGVCRQMMKYVARALITQSS